MKVIVNRILPRVRENILDYWQKAYLEKRDRQDLKGTSGRKKVTLK